MSRTGPRRPGFVRGTVKDVRTVASGWRWGRRQQVPRSAEPYVPRVERTVFPTRWARTRPAIAGREVLQKGVLNSVLRAEVAPQVSGLDKLAQVHGSCVIVANHSSHLDAPLVLCTLPDSWRRRTAIAAAADYFFDVWWRATTSAMILNAFPIERRGGKVSQTPNHLLRTGWNVLVFPEGTRSHDGWMGRFHAGAAWFAIENDVPVVPVAITGSFAAMPRGRSWPLPGRPRVTVRYGDPIFPEAEDSPRTMAPRIQAAVSALLDEEQSTWWEATRRAVEGVSPDPRGDREAATWRRVWAQTVEPTATSGSASRRRAWQKTR